MACGDTFTGDFGSWQYEGREVEQVVKRFLSVVVRVSASSTLAADPHG